MAAGCLSANSQAVFDRLKHAVDAQGLEQKVQVCAVGCLRLCCEGPLVQVDPDGTLYQKVTAENAASIVGSLSGGQATAVRGDPGGPFFAQQASVVLEHCGLIEPERIESYIGAGGYLALAHVLHEMEPANVVDEIVKSGLRGRGGAGYPTGVKWSMVAKQPAERKYVVCNADEGDPGAFMNRSVLEGDPHKVLEGMAIAGYAVGANQGYIYVRGEYPLAIERLKIGIKQANKLGLLGSRICSSPFDFTIDIRIGAGAFVCGEETALMASIMGGRGTPSPRPPYPAESHHAASHCGRYRRRVPAGQSQGRSNGRTFRRLHPRRALGHARRL
jgi:bidirectional [NiFe] hydrogenase diaphorase subunit